MINYWIFQYTTDVYPNVFSDLDNGILQKWEVNSHKSRIKKGDQALIYIGGNKGKIIYGLAEITSNIYYLEDKGKYYCDINILKQLTKNNLTFKKVKEHIPNMNIGISGTNFSMNFFDLEKIIKFIGLQKKR